MGRPLCRVHPWPGLPPAEWGPACSGPAGVHWLSSGSCVRRRVVRSRLSPRHLPHPAPPSSPPPRDPPPGLCLPFSVTRRRHLHRHTHATWDTRHTHETPHTEHSAPPHTHSTRMHTDTQAQTHASQRGPRRAGHTHCRPRATQTCRMGHALTADPQLRGHGAQALSAWHSAGPNIQPDVCVGGSGGGALP